MKAYSKRAILKYRIASTIVFLMWMTLFVVLWIYLPLGGLLFLPVWLFLDGRVSRAIAYKTMFSVLCENLDAVEFQKLVNFKHWAYASNKATAAMAIGDYQFPINIATSALNKKNSRIKAKCFCFARIWIGWASRKYTTSMKTVPIR